MLIIKLSSIGDVVHALPVASALRRQYPHVRISWAIEEWTAPLVVGHPAVDRVVVFPPMRWGHFRPAWLAAFRSAAHSLRREHYDVCLDLQGLLKSSVIALLSRAPLRLGVRAQREGAWLVSQAVPLPRGHQHVVHDYVGAAVFLGAQSESVRFEVPIDPQAAASIAERLSRMHISPATPLIVVNPSGSARWKNWPAERWARVAREMAAAGTVVLVGNRAQMARHAEVLRQAADGSSSRPLYDLTGQTSLAELVALLNRCAVHLAPDTGSAHIAAALGRPVVGLYGPTQPWRRAPYGQSHRVIYRANLCGRTCPRWCLQGRRCLEAVHPDELIAKARDAMEF